MKISAVIQFILGFIIGILILSGVGAATAYFLLSQLANTPPQPDYEQGKQQPEDSVATTSPESEQEESDNNLVESEQSDSPAEEEASEEKQSTPQETESEEEPSIQERFGEQAYPARVTWSTGLTVRSGPSVNSSRVGGVDYNDKLIILGKSSDGEWQKVYVPETEQQGWVSSGNVKRIN